MGIFDILYNEVNRIRDRKVKEKEKTDSAHKIAVNVIQDILLRIEIIEKTPERDLNAILSEVRYFYENLINVIILGNTYINEKIINRMKELSSFCYNISSSNSQTFKEEFNVIRYLSNDIKDLCGQILEELNGESNE